MGYKIDLTGKVFGKWTVLGFDENSKPRKPRWICMCSCEEHTIRSVSSSSLISGRSTSCRCLKSSDITGKVFGRLTVLEFDKKLYDEDLLKDKLTYKWICECECGNIVRVYRNNLIKGNTMSCGCLHKENTHKARFDDLTGQKFGKLTVLNYDEDKSTTRASYWNCLCECGNETSVWGGNLKTGHTSSCGCLKSYIESVCCLYFKEIEIEFIHQHMFENCIYKQPLRFDFYLSNYNCCIEFDGLHHFEPVTFGGRSIKKAKKDFKETHIKDKIKNEYCENNNIKLIRIPYWDFDIYKDILFTELGIGGEICQ